MAEPRSYKKVLAGDGVNMEKGQRLKQIAARRREGGNVIVDLDVEEYRKGVEYLKFSIVGRLSLQRGEDFPTNKTIREKLEAFWGLSDFKLIPLKGGIYHVLFSSMHG